jgi:hypothetical protein
MQMKIVALISIFFSSAIIGYSQDSWKVKLNSKLILGSAVENEIANTKKVKLSDLDKHGTLDILYKQANHREGWKRSLLFFDENDNEILRLDSVQTTTRIKNTQIKKRLNRSKTLKIYTVTLPTDPNKAAAIRVRRVHLCTIEWQ